MVIDDDLSRGLMERIRALVRRFSIVERADLSCCGMTVAQAATLDVLNRENGLRLGELGRRLGVSNSTLTRNLDRLRRRGLVSTSPDPADRRAFIVSLTPAGRRSAAEVARIEEGFARAIAADLGAPCTTEIIDLMDQLLAAIRSASDECCPGAFDHLMPQTLWGEGKKESTTMTNRADAVVDRSDPERIVDQVKQRYGAIAQAGDGGCCAPQTTCCGTGEQQTIAINLGYQPADLDLLPEGANLGLGCGAPINHLDLQAGERVLDLGSGAGIDALLAARKVGVDGHVIGVDMTPEMLASARKNAAAAGVENVDFREGRLEAMPVEDGSVDAVTSNCVINLVPDKAAVFGEIHRVLRPGGRVVVSDIVLDGDLPEVVTADLLAYVGCVAGAMRREAYFEMLADAGLADVDVLRDVDFLGSAKVPADIRKLAEFAGVRLTDLEGIVRSVTYRAYKR